MARNSISMVESKNVKFVEVSSRRFVIIELDLTSDDWDEDSIEFDDLNNAVVKIVVKYFQGEKASAESIVEKLITKISEPIYATHHIRKPEYFPVRKIQSRASEIVAKLSPLDAAEKFLDRFQTNIDRDELLRLLKEHLVGTVEREVPQSANYAVRKMDIVNFMPFKGEHQIEIPDGVFGVFGKYVGNDEKSNRSGKSAFLDAILFGRYGKTKRGLPLKKYVHNGMVNGEIGMTFDVDGNELVSCRLFGKTSDLKAGDVAGNRNAQSHLDQVLGLSFEDFTRISFVGQNDVLGILTNTSSEIKAVISKWIGVGVWDDVFKSVSVELKKLVDRNAFLIAEEFSLQGNIEDLEKVVLSDKEIEILKTDFEKVVEHNVKFRELDKHTRKWKNELVEIDEIEKAKKKLKKLRDIVDIEDDQVRLKKKLNRVLEKVATGRVISQDFRNKISEIEEQIDEDFDGVCPVDKGSCPRVDEINGCQKTKKLNEQKLDELQKDLNEQKREFLEAKDTKRKLDTKLENLSDEYDLVKQTRESSEKECRHRNEVLSDLEDLKDMTLINTDDFQNRYLEAVSNVKNLEDNIRSLEKTKKAKSENDTELKIYQALKVITSKTGIPSLQIENAVLQIEETTNKFLESIDSDIMLRFDFERELDKPATACRYCGYVFPKSAKVKRCECGELRGKEMRDEFQVNVVEGESIQPLDADSGGGKTLLGLALRIALSKFVGSSILFLDEICASLDVPNLMKLMKMLVALNKDGFRQVFVITHRREIAETLASNLVVTRNQNKQFSEIDWM